MGSKSSRPPRKILRNAPLHVLSKTEVHRYYYVPIYAIKVYVYIYICMTYTIDIYIERERTKVRAIIFPNRLGQNLKIRELCMKERDVMSLTIPWDC